MGLLGRRITDGVRIDRLLLFLEVIELRLGTLRLVLLDICEDRLLFDRSAAIAGATKKSPRSVATVILFEFGIERVPVLKCGKLLLILSQAKPSEVCYRAWRKKPNLDIQTKPCLKTEKTHGNSPVCLFWVAANASNTLRRHLRIRLICGIVLVVKAG